MKGSARGRRTLGVSVRGSLLFGRRQGRLRGHPFLVHAA